MTTRIAAPEASFPEPLGHSHQNLDWRSASIGSGSFGQPSDFRKVAAVTAIRSSFFLTGTVSGGAQSLEALNGVTNPAKNPREQDSSDL